MPEAFHESKKPGATRRVRVLVIWGLGFRRSALGLGFHNASCGLDRLPVQVLQGQSASI